MWGRGIGIGAPAVCLKAFEMVMDRPSFHLFLKEGQGWLVGRRIRSRS